MLYLITAYGLAPVLVGNAVTWPIYWRMKRSDPALNRRKTIAEELKDAVAKEAAKHPAPPEQPRPAKPASSERAEPSGDALFGPQADRSPMVSRSVQEEAMLFYEDDDDEETGND